MSLNHGGGCILSQQSDPGTCRSSRDAIGLLFEYLLLAHSASVAQVEDGVCSEFPSAHNVLVVDGPNFFNCSGGPSASPYIHTHQLRRVPEL